MIVRLPVLDSTRTVPGCYGKHLSIAARACDRCRAWSGCAKVFGRKYGLRVLRHADRADSGGTAKEQQISPWGALGIDFVQWADFHTLAAEIGAELEVAKRSPARLVAKKDGQLIFRVIRADVRFLEVDILVVLDEVAVANGLRRTRRGRRNVWRLKTADVESGWKKLSRIFRIGRTALRS